MTALYSYGAGMAGLGAPTMRSSIYSMPWSTASLTPLKWLPMTT